MGFATETTMPAWALALLILIFAYSLSLAQWHRRSRGLPLPPGPRSWPFIGNLVHMRKPEPWKSHHELCQLYGEWRQLSAQHLRSADHIDAGELVYLPVLSQSVMILGSARVLSELLDKRSAVTSDKLQSVLIPL